MADIIRLLIIILIAVFYFHLLLWSLKASKSMFWFSIEVLFLLGIILLIKEFFIEFFA